MYKIVVFDLDETIGNFLELSTFIEALEDLNKKELTKSQLFKLFDVVPDVFRPNIFKIFKYLIKKKKKNKNIKIIIYTNNQGPKSWTENIAKYIEYRLGTKIFDQIIGAYKVDGIIIEQNRTTHDKTKSDFLRCTNLPDNSQICFIDDQYHEYMNTENIYYLNIKPYFFQYTAHEIGDRYYNEYKPKINKTIFMERIITYMKMYKAHLIDKTKKQSAIDIIIGKQILISIKEYFKEKKNITKKRLKKIKSVKDYDKHQKNKTRKLSKRSKNRNKSIKRN